MPLHLPFRFSSILGFLVCVAPLSLSCSAETTEEVHTKASAFTPPELSTLGFEAVSQWSSPVGPVTLASSTLHSEGAKSLSLANFQYAQVRNITALKKDSSPVPETVSFDIRIPEQTPNPHWRGAVELYVDAPSVGVWGQYLGYRSLDALPREQFTRVQFPVPNAIQIALRGNYTDLKFTIAVNVPAGSQPHYLDRFVIGADVPPPTCVPVDDRNPCTADDCDATTKQPVHRPVAPGTFCLDANACNGAEACNAAGVCAAGAPPVVDDGSVCTADACSPSAGVTHTPVAVGTSCTDGNACNGSETCGVSGVCGTGIAPAVDDGNPCTIDSCSPTTGVSHMPVTAGTSCTDANACNGAETCNAAGACQAGMAPVVDDGNACTADSCTAAGGVTHVAVAAGTSCADANACNGLELCNAAGTCSVGSAPAVDDGNPCTVDSCDTSAGVLHLPAPAATACGDSNACNGVEACNGTGACVTGTSPTLDDGNPCTADACSPTGGVFHTPVAAGTSCSDGNACNGSEACNSGGSCVAGATPNLDDGNVCTVDSCDSQGGVTHVAALAGTACGDSNACNGAETCNGAGACAPGTLPVVDDNNPCTVDSCSASTGVAHVPASAGTSCTDGNACNGTEACSGGGLCQAGIAPTVDDANSCTVDSCSPAQGVTHVAAVSGTACSDGDACNGSEVCNGGGTCLGGGAPTVDDGNPCTKDRCDANSGVHHDPETAGTACGDGRACDDYGVCVASSFCGINNPLLFDPCGEGRACNPAGECEVVPATIVAPILNPTVISDISAGLTFLHTGSNPNQRGVLPGTIDPQRTSLLSGLVLDGDSAPLAGVLVDAPDVPALGYTFTRPDGRYDYVVNAGGEVRLRFRKTGFVEGQRTRNVEWNTYASVPDIALVPLSSSVTSVELGASFSQIAESEEIVDEDGSRTHRVMVPPETGARLQYGDGSESDLSDLSIRVSEFTVGGLGPARMPAQLPGGTAYTMAFEISADEVFEAGAKSVIFDRPLYHYVDNFLGVPVGTTVPVGYFDRDEGVWRAVANGLAIRVLGVDSSGHALVDVSGQGASASATELERLGFTEEELSELGFTFPDGANIWRTPLEHFSLYDQNFAGGPDPATPGSPGNPVAGGPGPGGGSGPAGGPGTGPGGPDPSKTGDRGRKPGPTSCEPELEGSSISVGRRAVSEEIAIPGTTHKLIYSSDRAEQTGRTRLDIVGPDVPEGLQYAHVRISVAGKTEEYILPAQANQTIVHEFDGKNTWGGAVYGPQRLDIEVTYYYPTFYYEPDVVLDDVHTPPPAFGLLPRKFIEPRVPARVLDGTRITATTYVTKSPAKAVPSLANGWSLNSHHRLDVITGNVFLGTGGIQTNDVTAEKLPYTAGYTWGVAPLPNGAVVYQDAYSGALYYWDKTTTQGPPRVLVESGATAPTADQRGNVYFIHEQRIKRWRSAANTVETMAGNGQVCPGGEQDCGDGGPASEARLHLASTNHQLAVGPDGAIYLAGANERGIRVVTPGGRMESYAGAATQLPVSGMSAREALLTPRTLATDSEGSVYFTSIGYARSGGPEGLWLYKIDAGSGVLTALAGGGSVSGSYGNYDPGLNQPAMNFALGMVSRIQVAGNGVIFAGLTMEPSSQSMLVGFVPGGRVSLITSRNDTPTMTAYSGMNLAQETGVYARFFAIGPEGIVLAGAGGSPWKARSFSKRTELYRVRSSDGESDYLFDSVGRHLRTVHAKFGGTIDEFAYDARGALTSVRDGFGNTVSLAVGADGATAIVTSRGASLVGHVNGQGQIIDWVDSNGGTYSMTYAGGLIDTFTDGAGRTSTYEYNTEGEFDAVVAQSGGRQRIAEQSTSAARTSIVGSGTGLVTLYETIRSGKGTQFRMVAPSGDIESIETDPAGTQTAALADGTTVRESFAPHPVFGQQAPVRARQTITLPSGLVRTETASVSVAQSGGKLVAQTLSRTVGSGTETVVLDYGSMQSTRTTAGGRLDVTIWDSFGRVIEVRPPGGARLRAGYSGSNVTSLELDPDGNPFNNNGRVQRFVYDQTGSNLTQVIDSAQNSILIGGYSGDKPTTLDFMDSSRATLGYDVEGNLTSVTPPGKGTHSMSYGRLGRIQSYAPPEGNAVTFEYDLDKRISKIDFGSSASSAPSTVEFRYHPLSGDLEKLEVDTGTTTFDYADGHLATVTAPSIYGPIASSILYDGIVPSSIGWAGPVLGQVSWTYNSELLIQTETIGTLAATRVDYAYDPDGLVIRAGDVVLARAPTSGRVIQETSGRIRETLYVLARPRRDASV